MSRPAGARFRGGARPAIPPAIPIVVPSPGRGGARTFRASLAAGLFAAACGGGDDGPQTPARIGPEAGYEELAATIGAFVEAELEDKAIPGAAITLTRGDRIVWAQGFGEARPGVPADADSLFRVGSVSKLFTDLAVLNLAENGSIDLDADVRGALPDFSPGDGGARISLRQLMAHRAGLVREPLVGHYFDDTAPTLAATVASLNGVPLVFAPGERQKYSNAGIAVVGRVLEERAGKSFAEAVTERVLAPLGLGSSWFSLAEAQTERIAAGAMWSYDGREFPAPTFPLGMAPAGSMVTSVRDLGRFLTLLDRKELPGVLSAAGLAEMWRVQYPAPGDDGAASTGFGLGFHISELEAADGAGAPATHRLVGHGGAIYGFSTELAYLPEAGLGAVAVTNVDFTNAVAGRIARGALKAALAPGEPPRSPARSQPLPEGLSDRLHGVYASDDGARVRILARKRRAEMEIGSGVLELRHTGRPNALVADSRLAHGLEVEILDEAGAGVGARG